MSSGIIYAPPPSTQPGYYPPSGPPPAQSGYAYQPQQEQQQAIPLQPQEGSPPPQQTFYQTGQGQSGLAEPLLATPPNAGPPPNPVPELISEDIWKRLDDLLWSQSPEYRGFDETTRSLALLLFYRHILLYAQQAGGEGAAMGGSGSLFTKASMAARDRRDFNNTVAVIPSGFMDTWKIYGGFFTFGKSLVTTPYGFYSAISLAVAGDIPAYMAVIMVVLALFDFGVNIWVLRDSIRDYKEIRLLRKSAEKREEEREEQKDAEIQLLVGGGKAENFSSFQIMFGRRIHIIRNLTTLPNIVVRIYVLALLPLNPSPVSTAFGIISLLLFVGSVVWTLGQHTKLVATYYYKKGAKNVAYSLIGQFAIVMLLLLGSSVALYYVFGSTGDFVQEISLSMIIIIGPYVSQASNFLLLVPLYAYINAEDERTIEEAERKLQGDSAPPTLPLNQLSNATRFQSYKAAFSRLLTPWRLIFVAVGGLACWSGIMQTVQHLDFTSIRLFFLFSSLVGLLQAYILGAICLLVIMAIIVSFFSSRR